MTLRTICARRVAAPLAAILSLTAVSIAVLLNGTPAAAAPTAASQDEHPPTDSSDADPAIAVLVRLMETIAERHVDPPAQIDMMAAVLRGVSDSSDRSLQRRLREELLTAETDAARTRLFAELFRQHATQVATASAGVRAGAESLRAILPSGLELISAEENRVNEQLAANRYVGIGIQLAVDQDANRPTIPRVFEGGPADTAGAIDGDIIVSVDGRDTAGVGLADVVQWLRGPEGSEVTVALETAGSSNTRTLTMTRGVVPIASVEKPVYDSDQSIAGLTVERLAASTVHELRRIEQQLPETTHHVVFDLRKTTAEDLHNVELLASALIDGGVYGQLRQRSGLRTCVAEPGRLFADRTILMLVSPRTAKPVWWLAAALNDTNSGLVLLEQSLELREAGPAVHHIESVPLRTAAVVPPGPPAAVARFATGEFLRADERPLASILPELGSLSRGREPFPGTDSSADGAVGSAPRAPESPSGQSGRPPGPGHPLAEQQPAALETLLPVLRTRFAETPGTDSPTAE